MSEAIHIAARLVREAPQEVEGCYMSRCDRQSLAELMRKAAHEIRELHDELKKYKQDSKRLSSTIDILEDTVERESGVPRWHHWR